ncbi:Uncharacterized protein SCF082_LOCUS34276 [Durusdinium trenchii]|uniref:Uncharacterized protein n=1 Tax=Durusdinium trenchii TaxID=1381693 RepID=A0ABP0NYR4_9DINO
MAKTSLTEMELQRLRLFETQTRVNQILIQTVDFITDIGFVCSLYLFSEPGEPGDSFLGVLAQTYSLPGDEPRDFDLFRALFGVSLFFLLLNVLVRLFWAASLYRKYKDQIDGPKDHAHFLLGALITQAEPHQGTWYIQNLVRDESPPPSDYQYYKQQRNQDVLLLSIEDLPQFILQIIFSLNTSTLTVTWYLAIFTTVLKIVSASIAIAAMTIKLPTLKKQDTQVSA